MKKFEESAVAPFDLEFASCKGCHGMFPEGSAPPESVCRENGPSGGFSVGGQLEFSLGKCLLFFGVFFFYHLSCFPPFLPSSLPTSILSTVSLEFHGSVHQNCVKST